MTIHYSVCSYYFLYVLSDSQWEQFHNGYGRGFLNSYHPDIVFTVKENPDHFLDTSFTYDNKFNCRVHKKPGKLPMHWKSEIPTKWKRNCITGALHRAKCISSNFDSKLKTLETTFLNVGYHKSFISHTVKSFLEYSS